MPYVYGGRLVCRAASKHGGLAHLQKSQKHQQSISATNVRLSAQAGTLLASLGLGQ